MKRIIEYRKLFGITESASLGDIKTLYRNFMKEWHPDKFVGDETRKLEAEEKSKSIIEAYHFLVSISPETHASNFEEYTLTTTTAGIEDYAYKGQTLKVTFQGGIVYEYFGVPKNVYNNFMNSSTMARFARRHIFHSYLYRKV
jgi:DnaJ-class molecular chaperone